MALNQVGLERLNTATTKKIGTNKNLIINGAMQVAQRGTSATANGYNVIDRFQTQVAGADESPSFSQVDVASGTSPYKSGFRKAFKVLNGNQTSGAGSGDKAEFIYKAEAQDIANSGWDYTDPNSFITLSFWVKASVAQNYYGYIISLDGTSQNFPFETGSLTADTWTKIVKKIPGNSNLQFDNDANEGLRIVFQAFMGTDSTGSVSLDTWAAFSGSTRTPNQTSTWWTTDNSTWEFTGVQLEFGSVATDFEHRSFGEELALCQRYFFKNANESGENGCTYAKAFSTNELFSPVRFPVAMRATPTVTVYGNQGSAGTVHKLGGLPDKSITSVDRMDEFGGMRINSSGQWATGDTDMYSFTFQAESEI